MALNKKHFLRRNFFGACCLYRFNFLFACETTMDELSYFGIGFTVLILGLACLMAVKLSSKTAYH